MEYHFPSQFDENGFNIQSPVVQSMFNGGVGYTAPPTNTFKYNGESPTQTYYNNQYANPQYGNQQNMDYYTNLGAYANQQMALQQQAVNANNGYYYNQNPYYMNQPAVNDPYNDQRLDAYRDAYNTGAISLTDYCYYANAGIKPSFTGLNGKTQSIYNTAQDSWYGAASFSMQAQMEQQKRMQEEYEEQIMAWNLCAKVCNAGLGKTEEEAPDIRKQIEIQQKWQKYYADRAREDYEQDCFSAYMKSLPNSMQPGYVSPLKAHIINNWNRYWHIRNDKYPENYGLEEFFNKGIMESMIIDDLDIEAQAKARHLDRLYDRQEFRNTMHQLHPNYDPTTGISIGGAGRLGIDDIEITVPQHLRDNDYAKRREKFMNSILANNTINCQMAR